MATLTPDYAFRNYVAPGPDGIAQGTSGNDDIYATANGQTLIGGGGDDVFHIGTFTGVTIVVPADGSGINTVSTYLSDYTLPALVDNLSALGDYSHTLIGNDDPEGNVITGAGGDDTIFGMGGPDDIWGGGGNDKIDPGTGSDFMDGQSGNDLFTITAGNGTQTIFNFVPGTTSTGEDVTLLANFGYTNFQQVRDDMTAIQGGGTVLHLPNGEALNFMGYDPSRPFTVIPGPDPDQFVAQNFLFSGATTGPDTLVLHVSEDAWNGDAQFTVSVDGNQIGEIQTATASHGLGQTQDITLNGDFGTGSHTVAINFINDAWGGSVDTDRNLYIGGITLNGTDYAGETAQNTAMGGQPDSDPNAAEMYVNGTVTFDHVGGPPPGPSTIVLHLSEDAWGGDAQFVVSIDGVQQGGTQTVTASHSAGQTQDITITGDFGPQGPSTIDLSFLNDAWGGSANTDRNLYIESLDVNGVNFLGNTASNNAAHGGEATDPMAAVMDVNGTATFHIDHTAPPEFIG